MTEPTAARVALADRVHFTGRHDDVDPSPGPSACADTDCMTLRRLIAELEQAKELVREASVAMTTGAGEYGLLERMSTFLKEKP